MTENQIPEEEMESVDVYKPICQGCGEELENHSDYYQNEGYCPDCL